MIWQSWLDANIFPTCAIVRITAIPSSSSCPRFQLRIIPSASGTVRSDTYWDNPLTFPLRHRPINS